ncbi:unnamed protein product [Nezara viridula]|uniref:Uncharacterized protein n=1 Tax=Nezara viridula TaxID=85310 RepID=A0A9P0MSG4_NEZVI|nr:unnamed protein product [Nezara viridula]
MSPGWQHIGLCTFCNFSNLESVADPGIFRS